MATYNPNPEVQIPGYGTLPLNTLKSEIKRRVQELAKFAQEENWNQIYFNLKPQKSGVLQTFVKALEDAEAALETPQMKRAKTISDRKALKENWLNSKSLTDSKF